jgi:hypothetical protein
MPLKTCRRCAEEIKEAAKICPHCQHSTGRGFIIRDDLIMIVSMIGVGGAFLFFAFQLIHSRDFSKYRDDIAVIQSKVVSDGKRDGRRVTESAKVVATVTNKGNYAWKIDSVEVRFYDDARKMVDAMTARVSASVLPRAAGALSINLYTRSIESNAVSHEVLVQHAREAKGVE